MRPFEAAVIGANLIAFAALAIPLPITLRWLRLAAPIALLAAIVQVTVEGPRWQMYIAYALTILFFLIWLTPVLGPAGIRGNRVVAGIGIALGLVAMLVAVALPLLLPVFHFRKPTGPYAIGTMTYHWVDVSRAELFTANPNDQRELMAQIWYPARDMPSAPRAPYLPEAEYVAPALARVANAPGFFLDHFKYVTTNAVVSAPMADNQSKYPVLIYLTGLYGYRQANTFQVEELVSHGYVVLGLDQPGGAALVHFPDGHEVAAPLPKEKMQPLIDQSIAPVAEAPTLMGRVMPEGILPYFADDVRFALDQLARINRADQNGMLTGRLDLDRIGIFGISLGAMNAAEACVKDARLEACLMMDAAMPVDAVTAGLRQPAMFITRDADTMRLERQRSGGWAEKDIAETLNTMRALYESLPGDGYYLEIPKIFHINFTDAPYWSPSFPQVGLTGPIDGQRGFGIINAYTVAFFDKELKGQASPLLEGPSGQYPEVKFESRRP